MRPTKTELESMLSRWREEASGHYCQTYNQGMAEGLRKAARELENVLYQTRLTTGSTVTAAPVEHADDTMARGAAAGEPNR
jgi:hypothetical protein